MLQKKTRVSTEYKKGRRNAKQICWCKKRQFEENLLYDLEEKLG
jgi:hypothetical protein